MRKAFLQYLGVSLLVTSLLGVSNVMAQEPPAGEPASGQAPASDQRKTEVYAGLSILGTLPTNENLNVGGATISNTNAKGSAGAGLKAGIFPKFAGGIFGVEGEVFGHGGKLNASPNQAQGDLAVVNFMVNVLARYPGEIIQPYVGAGFGVSAGQLSDANIQVGGSQLTGKAGDGAFAYQFLGGVRAYVTKKIFLFGEYKYFAANYKWESQGINTGNPVVKYDFRTQIISGGIGISF
jgi:opacity protein-like surface antigen